MIIFQAIILGIVEGLTEFLPISSTGHVIIAQRVIGYKDAAEIFTIVIQVGAIGAVLWHYRHDLVERVKGLFQRRPGALAFWRNWIVATIPAGLVGLAVEKRLSDFATPGIIAISLIVGGVIIWLIETYHRPKPAPAQPQIDKLSTKQALQVGLYQVLSLVPGVSRSGATIMGGLLSGMDRVTATAFSFYLSLPILILASGLKLVKNHSQIANVAGGSTALIVGTIAAFISGLAVVSWLIKYVSKHDFKPFAYYRIGFGLLILVVLIIR